MLNVFHTLGLTAEEVGDSESFQMSCVLDASEQIQCYIHFSGMKTPAMGLFDPSAGVTNPYVFDTLWRECVEGANV